MHDTVIKTVMVDVDTGCLFRWTHCPYELAESKGFQLLELTLFYIHQMNHVNPCKAVVTDSIINISLVVVVMTIMSHLT